MSGGKSKLRVWAESGRPSTTRCRTCNAYPDALEDIREFLAMKARGATEWSVADFHRHFLKEEHNYALSITTLWNHIRSCEADLHEQTKR